MTIIINLVLHFASIRLRRRLSITRSLWHVCISLASSLIIFQLSTTYEYILRRLKLVECEECLCPHHISTFLLSPHWPSARRTSEFIEHVSASLTSPAATTPQKTCTRIHGNDIRIWICILHRCPNTPSSFIKMEQHCRPRRPASIREPNAESISPLVFCSFNILSQITRVNRSNLPFIPFCACDSRQMHLHSHIWRWAERKYTRTRTCAMEYVSWGPTQRRTSHIHNVLTYEYTITPAGHIVNDRHNSRCSSMCDALFALHAHTKNRMAHHSIWPSRILVIFKWFSFFYYSLCNACI